jgi:hypothetical protein
MTDEPTSGGLSQGRGQDVPADPAEARRVRRKVAAKRYYEANRERLILKAREHYAAKRAAMPPPRPARTPEERLAAKRAYYLANRERLLRRQHDRYMANREQAAEYAKRWAAANKDKTAAYRRKRLLTHPDRVRELARKWAEKDRRARGIDPRPPKPTPEERRAARSDYRRRHRLATLDVTRARERLADEKRRRAKGALPRPPLLSEAERRQRARAQVRRYGDRRDRAEPGWRARLRRRWYEQLSDEGRGACRARKAAAARRWYEANREKVIARSRARKQLEGAAMQFFRDKGILPKAAHPLQRKAALEAVRRLGLVQNLSKSTTHKPRGSSLERLK